MPQAENPFDHGNAPRQLTLFSIKGNKSSRIFQYSIAQGIFLAVHSIVSYIAVAMQS